MKNNSADNTVMAVRCEEYDGKAIEEIVSKGIRDLGFKPSGKVFVKPNVVVAHKPEILGNLACTNPTLIGASLQALCEQPGIERIDLGENCAIGFPTRMCFKYAGYYDEVEKANKNSRCPVGIFCIDEELRDSVFIGGMVHDNLRVSRKMARADTKIYLPKLKNHCVSNMTATVKLNIGICSDDERSIRHDFLLNEKIVDLLSVGYPDFTIMDAIDIGVGSEGFPIMRKLGLIVMGTNPIAVDMIGARLLGHSIDGVPYLKRAIERGYTPGTFEEIEITGDLSSLDDVDEQAKRIMPYDDEYYQWQDVNKEFERLNSPMRFFWGPYRGGGDEKCLTGCVMGIKMFLAAFEKYAGAEAFAKARPVVFVIGNVEEEIDAKGNNVYMFGSCAKAKLKNARKVIKIDKCFTTVSDMMIQCGAGLGMPYPLRDKDYVLPVVKGMLGASARKALSMRYLQDFGHFLANTLVRKV